ncbi:MAG: NAD(P)-binding protein [Tetrasphaera sp.]
MDIVTIGGSIAALACACALAEQGHRVTIIERAPAPPTGAPKDLWDWDRPTVPQARQSHAFASAGCAVIRERFPDTLTAMYAVGVREIGLAEPPPPSLQPFRGDASDAELTMLLSRRNILEWALHRDAASRSAVVHRYDTKVGGLQLDGNRVTGVVLDDGEVVTADLVIDAAGRRSPVGTWLAEKGIAVPEEESESSGITYYTRHYRRVSDRLGGPLNRGFGAGGVWDSYTAVLFLGDGDAFTISLGVSPGDEVFKGLRDADAFTALVAATPLLAGWLDKAVSVPASDVFAMGGLANSWTPIADDGAGQVSGLLRVGDSQCTTNPAYGRGVSLALTHAAALADRLAGVEEIGEALFAELVSAAAEHYRPWYDEARANDAARIGMWSAAAAGRPAGPPVGGPPAGGPPSGGRPAGPTASGPRVGGPPGGPPPGGPNTAAPLSFGLLAAVAGSDEVVWRRLARTMMMLDAPGPLYNDPEIKTRVGLRMAAGGKPPVTGLSRAEAIAVVSGLPAVA